MQPTQRKHPRGCAQFTAVIIGKKIHNRITTGCTQEETTDGAQHKSTSVDLLSNDLLSDGAQHKSTSVDLDLLEHTLSSQDSNREIEMALTWGTWGSWDAQRWDNIKTIANTSNEQTNPKCKHGGIWREHTCCEEGESGGGGGTERFKKRKRATERGSLNLKVDAKRERERERQRESTHSLVVLAHERPNS